MNDPREAFPYSAVLDIALAACEGKGEAMHIDAQSLTSDAAQLLSRLFASNDR